jgi:hypothetical protein
MNDQEKLEMYIANCKCCMLAQAMKVCPKCRFNIGLAEKVELVQPAIPLILQLFNEENAIFVMAD